MLADAQAGCVEHFAAQRGQTLAGDGARLLEPGAVKPYGGELHSPKLVEKQAPVIFVEFDDAALDFADLGGSMLRGTETLHALCCARNLAGGDATASDGVRLLSWAAYAARGMELSLPGGGLATIDAMGVRRMLTGEKLWAAVLSLKLIID